MKINQEDVNKLLQFLKLNCTFHQQYDLTKQPENRDPLWVLIALGFFLKSQCLLLQYFCLATAKARKICSYFNVVVESYVSKSQQYFSHISHGYGWTLYQFPPVCKWGHLWSLCYSYPAIRSVTNFCLSPCRWGRRRQFSTNYGLLNTLTVYKDNERKRGLPSQLNVLMSSADREVGLPEISLNLCLEASLSSYVYH